MSTQSLPSSGRVRATSGGHYRAIRPASGSHLPRVSCFHYGLRSRIFDQTDHTVSHGRGSYMSFASRGGRASVKASYPAKVVACRGLGRLQSRRHRSPLPWPDRRVGHRSRKVSYCKKRPAGELRMPWRGEGQPPEIFFKEVAQKQATTFPRQDLLTARNRF